MQTATNNVTSISFFVGISFNIKYHKIYIKPRYNRLKRLVSTTQRDEYMVSDNRIDITTIEFVNNNNLIYFFVNNFISENSFFIVINIKDIITTNIVSVK